ncbi:DUF3293 domain-containing protein [Shewanella intestini]|uniref:DUF3293 domain-containing protein n=1 Tax=Shewanella intestini TaxID=2017544 RepID=A0ABS5I3F1_9GAMM|nr:MULTISPECIES: DUF3293 domain-containing protein [Shewanella]MBR9728343.1 DUF3293 domain-containing protein [Shewanella intestini]MRG36685.1 DUF3293 domain-containing protein [Shewanella sp. XMDDZSB0408]
MNNVNSTLWQTYQHTQFLLTQRLSNQHSFAIITACNPFGSQLTSCQNRLLDRQLQQTIQQFKQPYRSLYGASPDLSHQEKSWAIFIDKEQALAVGRKFNQLAIYYVEMGRLLLLACGQAPQLECEIGRFDQRQRLVSELPDFEC